MRIFLLSDATMPTPTPGMHGLGRVAAVVAEGLLARGHDVVLFASPGSQFRGALVMPSDAIPTGYYAGEKVLAREALKLHREWPADVFIDMGHLHYLSRMLPGLPVVNVYHDIYQPYAPCPVLLSEGQRALMPPEFENARIIPNALDPAQYSPKLDMPVEDYVLFAGAISEIKQPILAIEACARLGVRLILAGQLLAGNLPLTPESSAQYVGVVSGRTKAELFQNARVFLQLGVGESYGLTTVEAGLYGVPVVAWPSGGALDLIRYGYNGVFVPVTGADKVQNVCDAIERAWFLRRDLCRAQAEAICNPKRQIDAYESAASACMRGQRW